MAVAEFDGHVLEQRLLTELNSDIGGGNHGAPVVRYRGVAAGVSRRTAGRGAQYKALAGPVKSSASGKKSA
jgi:hypothetical protein